MFKQIWFCVRKSYEKAKNLNFSFIEQRAIRRKLAFFAGVAFYLVISWDLVPFRVKHFFPFLAIRHEQVCPRRLPD